MNECRDELDNPDYQRNDEDNKYLHHARII